MKKVLFALIALAVCVSFSRTAFAGGSSKVKVKYPIILVHGWAGSFLYLNAIEYFYGIEDELEDEVDVANTSDGIFVADGVDAFNTDDVRGAQLRAYIYEVMAVTGAKKVNIIGHSMGGTTARYTASCFTDMKTRVASVTTISTPHRGTSAGELMLMINDGLMGSLAWVMDNLWGKIASGDQQSRFVAATEQLTREGMAELNPLVPDVQGIAYFSYATKYYGISSNVLNNIMFPFFCWMNAREGANDGVVPVSSMKWGVFKGEVTGLFGCDHAMVVNHLFGITPGFDAKGFYVDIAKLLSSRGY